MVLISDPWEAELSEAELVAVARLGQALEVLERLGVPGGDSAPDDHLLPGLLAAGAIDRDGTVTAGARIVFDVLAAPEGQWTVVSSGPDWSSSTTLLLGAGHVVEHEEPVDEIHRLAVFPDEELLLRLSLLAGAVQGDAPVGDPFDVRLADLERWIEDGGRRPLGSSGEIWEALHERRTVSVLWLEPGDDQVLGGAVQWLAAPSGVWFVGDEPDPSVDGDDPDPFAEDGDSSTVSLTPRGAREVFAHLAASLPAHLQPPAIEDDEEHVPTGDSDGS